MKNYNFTNNLSALFIKNSEDQLDTSCLSIFDSVIYVNSIDDALIEFEKNHIDIVIVEVEANYDETIKFIYNIKLERNFILTILISSNITSKFLIENIEVGIDEFILSPIDNTRFISRVESLEKKYLLGEEYKTDKENLKLSQQYQSIIDKSSIISKTDLKGIITYVNDNFCKISGYTREELIGKNHNIVRDPNTPKNIYKELWETIKDKKQQWDGIIKNISKNGKTYNVKSTITPILDYDDNILEYIALRQNISSILNGKHGLFNEIESNKLSILILIQIKDFNILEKFYNLVTIDQIETMFGQEILAYLPDTYKFKNVYNLENGRYGLLADFDDYSKSKINLEKYLIEFIDNVEKSTLDIDGIEYDVNISLSYALGKYMIYEDAKSGLDEAVEQHNSLCYSNDFSIKYYNEAKKNLDIIKMVKIALDNYNIVSYFQPIINNKTNKIEKYESLVRLIDENDEVLSPYEFLNISKKGSYYNKITMRVLENSFKMLRSLNIEISVNLSTLDIEKDDTRKFIYSLLEEYKSDIHRLTFELLEDEDIKIIKIFIKKIKKMGVSIAIDDFGVGYSNFERLLEFDPDIIKIDGSLIKNIITDKYSQNVIETIVTLAKKQNIKTVAEYVESEEIFEALKTYGIDYSQGYYFGKPKDLTIN